MLTPDLLRTGAALVKALKEGDQAARLALSDFFEEYGIPNSSGDSANEDTAAISIEELRKEPKQPASRRQYAFEDVGGVSVSFIFRDGCYRAYCQYYGPSRRVWVGTWPLPAWEPDDGPYTKVDMTT